MCVSPTIWLAWPLTEVMGLSQITCITRTFGACTFISFARTTSLTSHFSLLTLLLTPHPSTLTVRTLIPKPSTLPQNLQYFVAIKPSTSRYATTSTLVPLSGFHSPVSTLRFYTLWFPLFPSHFSLLTSQFSLHSSLLTPHSSLFEPWSPNP